MNIVETCKCGGSTGIVGSRLQVTLGVASLAVSVVGLVEGIIYLTKTPEEFELVYVQGRKPWF